MTVNPARSADVTGNEGTAPRTPYHRSPTMKTTAILAATAAVAIVLAHPCAASADTKHFNVTVGGPGYAVSVGNAGFGVGYYGGTPGYGTFGPAPVVLPAPVFGPVYAPAPVYVAPRVVYRHHRPYRAYYAPVPVAYRPYHPAAPFRPAAPYRYAPY